MSGCAWVTLATNDTYCLGALVLAHSLKKVSTRHHLAIIITPQVSPAMREQLSKVFDLVHCVDVLDSQDATNLALLQRPDLGVTFTKIHCWTLTQYSKCVFLDADTLVMQNCDELMEREELSAAPDPGWPDCFNSGVFVFVPSEETFKQLIQFASTHGSFDGGDQGLLNMYFNDWPTNDIRKHLSFLYNMCSTSTYTYLPALKYYGANIKIVHFIGANKPWLLGPSGAGLSTYTQAWWDTFQSSVVQNLSKDMSGLAGALGSKEKSAIEEQWRKQNWEQGNIDFTGLDSFDKIWQKIMEAVNKPKVETAKPTEEKAPETPIPKEIASQAICEKEKAEPKNEGQTPESAEQKTSPFAAISNIVSSALGTEPNSIKAQEIPSAIAGIISSALGQESKSEVQQPATQASGEGNNASGVVPKENVQSGPLSAVADLIGSIMGQEPKPETPQPQEPPSALANLIGSKLGLEPKADAPPAVQSLVGATIGQDAKPDKPETLIGMIGSAFGQENKLDSAKSQVQTAEPPSVPAEMIPPAVVQQKPVSTQPPSVTPDASSPLPGLISSTVQQEPTTLAGIPQPQESISQAPPALAGSIASSPEEKKTEGSQAEQPKSAEPAAVSVGGTAAPDSGLTGMISKGLGVETMAEAPAALTALISSELDSQNKPALPPLIGSELNKETKSDAPVSLSSLIGTTLSQDIKAEAPKTDNSTIEGIISKELGVGPVPEKPKDDKKPDAPSALVGLLGAALDPNRPEKPEEIISMVPVAFNQETKSDELPKVENLLKGLEEQSLLKEVPNDGPEMKKTEESQVPPNESPAPTPLQESPKPETPKTESEPKQKQPAPAPPQQPDQGSKKQKTPPKDQAKDGQKKPQAPQPPPKNGKQKKGQQPEPTAAHPLAETQPKSDSTQKPLAGDPLTPPTSPETSGKPAEAQPATPTVIAPTPPISPQDPLKPEDPLTAQIKAEEAAPTTAPSTTSEVPVPPKRKGKGNENNKQPQKQQSNGGKGKGKK